MLDVRLTPADPRLLEELVKIAAADADPSEVMPPVEGPPGWTERRKVAYLDFLEQRLRRTPDTLTFAVIVAGRVAGCARLDSTSAKIGDRHAGVGARETGLWLSRSARGLGVGTEVIRQILVRARELGSATVIAETTTDNLGSIGMLRAAGAELDFDRTAGTVRATFGTGTGRPANPRPDRSP